MSFRVEEIPQNSKLVWITPHEKFAVSSSLGSNWQPTKCALPVKYLHYANRIYNFDIKPDDVWILSLARSGSTLMQEMVWLLQNNLNYDMARSLNINKRSIFLDFTAVNSFDPEIIERARRNSFNEAKNLQSPRLIKSHLPVSFLPKQLWINKPKMIYIFRNPKDKAVSKYHFLKSISDYNLKFEHFLDNFLTDAIYYLPFWTHVLEFWKMRNDENILFLTYEEIINDIKNVIRKCCKFLEKNYTNEQIDQLAEHLSFKNMRDNPSCNHDDLIDRLNQMHGIVDNEFKFIRRGKVGSYKDEMPKEYIDKFDKWIYENIKNSDFSLKY